MNPWFEFTLDVIVRANKFLPAVYERILEYKFYFASLSVPAGPTLFSKEKDLRQLYQRFIVPAKKGNNCFGLKPHCRVNNRVFLGRIYSIRAQSVEFRKCPKRDEAPNRQNKINLPELEPKSNCASR